MKVMRVARVAILCNESAIGEACVRHNAAVLDQPYVVDNLQQ